jgi:hypothetical protein
LSRWRRFLRIDPAAVHLRRRCLSLNIARRMGPELWLEAVMNLLRNGLLMRKTGSRRRPELTETFAFLCGFPAEFITRSRLCCVILALWDRSYAPCG